VEGSHDYGYWRWVEGLGVEVRKTSHHYQDFHFQEEGWAYSFVAVVSRTRREGSNYYYYFGDFGNFHRLDDDVVAVVGMVDCYCYYWAQIHYYCYCYLNLHERQGQLGPVLGHPVCKELLELGKMVDRIYSDSNCSYYSGLLMEWLQTAAAAVFALAEWGVAGLGYLSVRVLGLDRKWASWG
jgi:hypothetical protein